MARKKKLEVEFFDVDAFYREYYKCISLNSVNREHAKGVPVVGTRFVKAIKLGSYE